jgi:hypothetical protein
MNWTVSTATRSQYLAVKSCIAMIYFIILSVFAFASELPYDFIISISWIQLLIIGKGLMFNCYMLVYILNILYTLSVRIV